MRTYEYAILAGLALTTICGRDALAAPERSYTSPHSIGGGHPPGRSPAGFVPNQVPEIDPGVGLRLIGLLGGAALAIRGRRKA